MSPPQHGGRHCPTQGGGIALQPVPVMDDVLDERNALKVDAAHGELVGEPDVSGRWYGLVTPCSPPPPTAKLGFRLSAPGLLLSKLLPKPLNLSHLQPSIRVFDATTSIVILFVSGIVL